MQMFMLVQSSAYLFERVFCGFVLPVRESRPRTGGRGCVEAYAPLEST